LGPRIPYSNPSSSQVPFVQLLRRQDIVKEVKRELNSENTKLIFPKDFLEEVVRKMQSSQKNTPKTSIFSSKLKSFIPQSIKKRIAQNQNFLIMDDNLLAFRIYIICRMHEILKNDTSSFKE
jgi:uncharacterized protein with von Willebrand factor type A (vWA) domain